MEKIEEYNAIRQEILVYTNHIKDYRNIAYTVTVATLAYSFSDKAGEEPFIGLLPLMVIIPLFLACERSYLGISKMGSYIRRFFYEEGFHWENRGPHFHRRLGHYEKREKKNFFEEEAVFIGLTIICCLVTIYKVIISTESEVEKYIRCIGVCFLLVIIIAFILDIRKYTSDQRKKYDKTWKIIKETEKKIGKPLF